MVVPAQRGSTLIEVLITIVVVSVGLLGMAALQMKSVSLNQSTYQRLQAINLAYEIADSIAINPVQAHNGNYRLELVDTAPQNAVVGSVAELDLQRWLAAVAYRLPLGNLIIGGPVVVPNMTAGSTARQYRIVICWLDKNSHNAVGDCGTDRASFEFLASSRI